LSFFIIIFKPTQAQAAKKEKDKLKNALKKEKKVIRTACKVGITRKTQNSSKKQSSLHYNIWHFVAFFLNHPFCRLGT
jgi:preprotein translocase subunit YajC